MSRAVKANYNDIPIGADNAISRAELSQKWECSDRMVRNTIAKLRAQDNGDDLIIVSHSTKKGYYRTNDIATIEWFVREQSKRARNTFLPLKKARRVLRERGGRNETHL